MKKGLTVILVLIACTLSSTVLAEGKLKATEKNLIIYDGKDSGRFYAKIENVGDSAISADSGDLVIFSDDDEIILSDSFITTLPSYVTIEPGDYLYVNEFLWDSALIDNPIGDYKLSVPTKQRKATIIKIPCEASMELNGVDTFENHIYVTFTNTTDNPLKNYTVVVAMHDDEGKLIYVESYSNSSVAIHAGSSVTVSISVDNDLMEYYQTNQIVPTTVDAMVCCKGE